MNGHASPGCACGVNGLGEQYTDPICRPLNPAPVIRLGGGHCCACSTVCHHIGGIRLCEQHQPRTQPVVVVVLPGRWPARV